MTGVFCPDCGIHRDVVDDSVEGEWVGPSGGGNSPAPSRELSWRVLHLSCGHQVSWRVGRYG